jgi:DNA-directed RNA polymerase specialized sigma24 family protein
MPDGDAGAAGRVADDEWFGATVGVVTRLVAEGVTDAVAIQASLRDGDQFAVLYDRYAAELYRYAYRRVGPQAAEDAVADCFLAAFRQRHRYDATRPMALPWLYGILAKELARRRRREQAHFRALARAVEDVAPQGLADQVVARVSAQVPADPGHRAVASAIARPRRAAAGGLGWPDL